MTKKQLRKNIKEVVTYMLAQEEDKELISSYTETLTEIAEEYSKSNTKKI